MVRPTPAIGYGQYVRAFFGHSRTDQVLTVALPLIGMVGASYGICILGIVGGNIALELIFGGSALVFMATGASISRVVEEPHRLDETASAV